MQGLGLCPTSFCPALQIGRGFQFKERNAKLTVEIRAGVITFFVVGAGFAAALALATQEWPLPPAGTRPCCPLPCLQVAYILAVNPSILATTGGTCNPEVDCTAEVHGARRKTPPARRCLPACLPACLQAALSPLTLASA